MEQNPLIQSIRTLNTFPLNPWPILRLDPVLQWETADHTINTPSFAYYRLIMQYHGEEAFSFNPLIFIKYINKHDLLFYLMNDQIKS